METGQSKKFEFEKAGVSVRYLANITNSQLSFNIQIEDKNINFALNEDFIVETTQPGLGDRLTDLIKQKAKRLKLTIDIAETKKIDAVMEAMRAGIISSMKGAELKDLRTQGLYVSGSLIKTILRAQNGKSTEVAINGIRKDDLYELTPDPNATVYAGFDRGLSGFVLNEDIVVNVADFRSYAAAGTTGAAEFITYVLTQENPNAPTMTMAEVTVGMDRWLSFFEPAKRYNGSGSSWGCCGNYNGPCYASNPLCYVHDYLCQRCDHWWCFGGCKPD